MTIQYPKIGVISPRRTQIIEGFSKAAAKYCITVDELEGHESLLHGQYQAAVIEPPTAEYIENLRRTRIPKDIRIIAVDAGLSKERISEWLNNGTVRGVVNPNDPLFSQKAAGLLENMIGKRELRIENRVGIYGGGPLAVETDESWVNGQGGQAAWLSEALARGEYRIKGRISEDRVGYKEFMAIHSFDERDVATCQDLDELFSYNPSVVVNANSTLAVLPPFTKRSKIDNWLTEQSIPKSDRLVAAWLRNRSDAILMIACNQPEFIAYRALLQGVPPEKILTVSADRYRGRKVINRHPSLGIDDAILFLDHSARKTHPDCYLRDGVPVVGGLGHTEGIESPEDLDREIESIGPEIMRATGSVRKMSGHYVIVHYRDTPRAIALELKNLHTYHPVLSVSYFISRWGAFFSAENPVVLCGDSLSIQEPEYSERFLKAEKDFERLLKHRAMRQRKGARVIELPD